MATPSCKRKADSDSTSEERASIVSSAKMHARKLQAELLYLRETGYIPADLEELVSGLMSSPSNRPVVAPPPPTKRNTPGHISLDSPLSIRVKNAFLGKNYRHIVASLGDWVAVFAWTENRTEAIAYNPRNQTAGLIPTAFLELSNSKPFTDTKLYMTTSNSIAINAGSDFVSFVNWKVGDYIRVWNRVEKGNVASMGFGSNITRGGIGKFYTHFDVKEII